MAWYHSRIWKEVKRASPGPPRWSWGIVRRRESGLWLPAEWVAREYPELTRSLPPYLEYHREQVVAEASRFRIRSDAAPLTMRQTVGRAIGWIFLGLLCGGPVGAGIGLIVGAVAVLSAARGKPGAAFPRTPEGIAYCRDRDHCEVLATLPLSGRDLMLASLVRRFASRPLFTDKRVVFAVLYVLLPGLVWWLAESAVAAIHFLPWFALADFISEAAKGTTISAKNQMPARNYGAVGAWALWKRNPWRVARCFQRGFWRLAMAILVSLPAGLISVVLILAAVILHVYLVGSNLAPPAAPLVLAALMFFFAARSPLPQLYHLLQRLHLREMIKDNRMLADRLLHQMRGTIEGSAVASANSAPKG